MTTMQIMKMLEKGPTPPDKLDMRKVNKLERAGWARRLKVDGCVALTKEGRKVMRLLRT